MIALKIEVKMCFIYLFVFFAYFVIGTNGCSCRITHPQNSFCNSDFVIKAVVINRTDPVKAFNRTDFFNDYVTFTLSLKRVFRGKNALTKILEKEDKLKNLPNSLKHAKLTITTANNDGMCGISPLLHKKYLMMGSIFDGKMHVYYCNYHGQWKYVQNAVKLGVNGGYDCSCLVKTGKDAFGSSIKCKMDDNYATSNWSKLCVRQTNYVVSEANDIHKGRGSCTLIKRI